MSATATVFDKLQIFLRVGSEMRAWPSFDVPEAGALGLF